MRFLYSVPVLVLLATPALADRVSYCAAYATDFANAQTKDRVFWQHKFEIAQQSCMREQRANSIISSPDASVIAKGAKTKTKEPNVQVAELVPPEPVMTTAKPEQGSDDWNAYCAKKYTSFNIKTGMYHSLKGIDRKCLVTRP